MLTSVQILTSVMHVLCSHMRIFNLLYHSFRQILDTSQKPSTRDAGKPTNNCMMRGGADLSASPEVKMRERAIHLASIVLLSQTVTEINAVCVLSIVKE